MLVALLAAALALSPAPRGAPPAPATVQTQTLTAAFTRADHEHYRELRFRVPAGAQRLSISVDYGREQRTTLDFGLFDPQRFRGWSGGARKRFELAETDATPGYLPGPLPAGEWRLLVGAPNIRTGLQSTLTATISVQTGAAAVEFAPAPLVDKAGWYRGDLHTHSGHSDGTCPTQSGARAPCPAFRTVDAAARRGLDFIALTDHDTTSQFDALRELQEGFDRVLLVPGREVTTFYGHANVFGPAAFLDFRIGQGKGGATVPGLFAAAHAAGGVVSINHPTLPSGEACMGCGWKPPGAAPNDPGPIAGADAVEVVNGSTMKLIGSAEGALQGVAFWEARLNQGERLTAVGGSDNHDASIALDAKGAIGSPTTVIYAQNLSVAALLDGLRSGRVFIDVDGTRERHLDLSAEAGTDGNEGRRVEMGGTLATGPGRPIAFQLSVQAPADARAEIIVDGKAQPLIETPELGGRGEIAFHYTPPDAAPHWLRANVRDAKGRLLLLGNPIYLRPAAP